jgi:hypothetical protein
MLLHAACLSHLNTMYKIYTSQELCCANYDQYEDHAGDTEY